MGQKTVFLIDDDFEDLQFMEDTLKKVDPSIRCVSFEYPEEGIKVLTGELTALPDYIFLDINMPKMNGRECLVQLRNDSKFYATPIILYSTSMPVEIAQELLQSGANFTFAKPNTEKEYFAILKNIILGNALQKQQPSTTR